MPEAIALFSIIVLAIAALWLQDRRKRRMIARGEARAAYTDSDMG